MSQSGTLSVRVFTSRAQIPVSGATVTVSQRRTGNKHTLLAIRVTDENGDIAPIPIYTPDASSSTHPGTKFPFTSLDIRVEHPNYMLEVIEDAQVFSGVYSLLPVQLIPLMEHANLRDSFQVVRIPTQYL